MKKQFLLILIYFLPSYAIAQDFEFPTTSDNPIWTFILIDDYGDVYGSLQVKMLDSTMVNGQSYSLFGTSELVRSEGNQVFILSQDSTEEYLLYDFDLEVGDTFIVRNDDIVNNPIQVDTFIVNQIDSILIGNEYRKIWYVGMAQWIEGIGCTNSITNPNYWGSVSGGKLLYCYGENGDFLLSDTVSVYDYDTYHYIYYGCDGIILNANELLKPKPVKIFPNPASNKIEINGLENENEFSVHIFNMNGQLIKTVENTTSILISNLEKGIYFLEINDSNNTYRERFVKI